jgi:hypothetical protein
MSIAYYMDVHMPWPLTKGLRGRGIDVIMRKKMARIAILTPIC